MRLCLSFASLSPRKKLYVGAGLFIPSLLLIVILGLYGSGWVNLVFGIVGGLGLFIGLLTLVVAGHEYHGD